MDIETLARTLAFRELQPDQASGPGHPGDEQGQALNSLHPKDFIGNLVAERANLILPDELNQASWDLMALADVPRMGSYAIAILLYAAVAAMPPGQVYLNIGVWHGFSLLAGMLARPQGTVIGVDNFSEFGGPKLAFKERFMRFCGPEHRFYDLDYVKYLREIHQDPIGVYFYDGPHRELDQSRGLELAHQHIAPGGLIFVDDTNLLKVQAPTLAFVHNHPEYRVIADFSTTHNCHPTWWNGLMILKKDETAPL